MKGLTYEKIKQCYDAQELLRSWNHVSPSKLSDRTYSIPLAYKSAVIYSQQEITIQEYKDYSEYARTNVLLAYPAGVKRVVFTNPWKEYIYFIDAQGIDRYYVIPTGSGLRLQKDGTGYKVMNPSKDYLIQVDRALAKDARKDADDFIQYIDTLWDMMPEPEEDMRINSNVQDKMPSVKDREKWHDYVSSHKYPASIYSWGTYSERGIAKETLLTKVRGQFTSKALAYKVTLVPDTETSHSSHWSKIEELREAGKLVQWEGENSSKQKKK